MGRFFNAEGPIMSFLNKVADIMLLNFITWICCIPIVTAGAAFTALHCMSLKIVRGEEGYIIKGYFQSFKQNFKQATVLWLIVAIIGCILAGDYYILRYTPLMDSKVIKVLLGAVGFVYMLTVIYIFPVLAKFENTVFNTIKNALLISFISLPRAILMLIIYSAPVLVFLFFPEFLPVVFLFGLSIPAYLAAKLYSKVLKKFEPQDDAAADADSWVLPEEAADEGQGGKDAE